ncbi:hypothetical protein HAN_3g442 (nucleomorph) [Hemiselmis andersenii]|uniref:Vitamin K epoxide reductase domain-containing protein n=1 Tax=Hemiselmis andersenii TaxID=464988 RepID=A9BL62_HEMAN|nr:hypothetical protein HAN_3g442 [Hemiselmis andersenii]ABW98245.1 hypothetical protein HAN_3g442 [Hemiselmis andersenii]|mmetsp:Transcript_20911/g.48315  ORF Transcript_20911/g.48315 Transcript_20911/m.48315 type:complete len:238 (-) Transcript_20911:72-785(-)
MNLFFFSNNFVIFKRKNLLEKFNKTDDFSLIKNFRIKNKKISLNILRTNALEKRTTKNGKKMIKNYFREIPSNRMVFFLSFLGISETFYLTLTKIFNSALICNLGTCSVVLNSPFSIFIGIPFSFFGLLLYGQIFVYILNKNNKVSFLKKDLFLEYFLVFFGFFEVYFSLVLEIVLKEPCEWCLLSILFCIGILTNCFFLQKNSKKVYNKFIIGTLFFFTFFQYLGNMVEISFFLVK